MSEVNFDVIVIGGGPGGYVAAIRARQLGLKTALVEKQHLGGVCLNWGCIPTKALLRSAEIYHYLTHLEEFGLSCEKPQFDIKAVVERSRNVASQLSQGIRHLMKKNAVTVFDAEGQLNGVQNGKRLVLIKNNAGQTSLQAKSVILATGARPRILPGLEPDNDIIWTSKEAMIPETMPKSLLVVGSGAIGIEFASFYNAFGVEVHVVELQDRILPHEDVEISTLARKAFEKKGIKIYTSSMAEKVEKAHGHAKVTLKTPQGKQSVTVERIISAVGIVGNTEDLGLEKTKVKVEKGHIVTHLFGHTDEPNVYAIGDVTKGPWLAHKASHEGVLCVEALAGKQPNHGLKRSNIPGCTYSSPQIASVGLTETQALDAGYALRVGRFPFIGNGKAIALGEPEGLVKTIFDEKTGELLGAHMIGAEVTELIQGFCVAKTLEVTEEELMQTIFPHPTLSEMMHESVLNAYGRALHF